MSCIYKHDEQQGWDLLHVEPFIYSSYIYSSPKASDIDGLDPMGANRKTLQKISNLWGFQEPTWPSLCARTLARSPETWKMITMSSVFRDGSVDDDDDDDDDDDEKS